MGGFRQTCLRTLIDTGAGDVQSAELWRSYWRNIGRRLLYS